MQDEQRRVADLKFLRETHRIAKSMGVSDNVTIGVALTDGNIHPEAMREYLKEHDYEPR